MNGCGSSPESAFARNGQLVKSECFPRSGVAYD
jgi:hypothetical protein